MAAEFDALGIERVGISTDTVEKAAGLKKQHGITMRLLSDATLKVTDLYNLRYSDGKTPIVTTILIGADGIVRWIDVTPDYRKRNQGTFVLKHVKEALAAHAATGEAEASAGSSVVLLDPGDTPIPLIREIRAITGLGLADAKAIVDNVPQPVRTNLDPAEAEDIAARLHTVGATAEVRESTAPN